MVLHVDIPVLAAAHADGALVVDVREPHEYHAGHVPNARHVPLGALAARVADLRGEGPVYVICQSGGRSIMAAELLASHGLEVRNVRGGTEAWIAAGHPVVAGPRANVA